MTHEIKQNQVPASNHMTDSGEMPSITSDEAWFTMNAQRMRSDSERLARIEEQLDAFKKIAITIGSDASIEAVLRQICDKTKQLMRAERTTIFLVEHDERLGDCLNSVIAEKCGVIRLRFGQGIAGNVAKTRQISNIKDVYQGNSHFDPSFDKKTGFVTRSCLTAPILNIQHELLGVVQVINKLNGYFTPDDEEIIASICSQIGVSLTQHQFYLSLLHKNVELSEAQDNLKRKNEELDKLYELEREAAVAIDLNTLIERITAKCLAAFRVPYAAIIVISGKQHDLYASQTNQPFSTKLLTRLPTFLSTIIRQGVTRQGECVKLSIREIQTLPEQTENAFGIVLNSILVVPFIQEEMPFGALVLGTQDLTPGAFSTSDAKLAMLFASHIVPSIGTHLDREENEKKQRLFAIGQMLSSLLHDMKTPLANISGYVELMTSQNDPGKRANYAEVVERQVETLKNMSSEILQFARGESTIMLIKMPLSKVIASAVELLKSEADRRNITIECDERFKGIIPYDFVKLQRVIVNLAKNAMEAIDHDGTIVISSYADDMHAYISIEDNGPGIPPNIEKTLFDAFVTSGKKGGTGLGLSIVKKIIDEHRASITWHTVEPHGTSFVMAFPL
ncbi:MAG: GAF domain-containing sensor histidine kinase [Proteobacteria bacterium]|nr:GAF domain-containing sensor histidine kinase [Pseudomonadota bacterium]